MERGLFSDSLTKICDLTNTPNTYEVLLLFYVWIKKNGLFASLHSFLKYTRCILSDKKDIVGQKLKHKFCFGKLIQSIMLISA